MYDYGSFLRAFVDYWFDVSNEKFFHKAVDMINSLMQYFLRHNEVVYENPTDSRSFLSYTRLDYFHRILCNLFGQMVEDGEYPADMKNLGQMVENISYNNTLHYFGFDEVL